jgi:CRISPR-associated RAMP protein (TIGR02581 family)
MDTALHVGSGHVSTTTDAGVVRDFYERPFIPGSSLKGVLRSAVERRAEWLGLRSCFLEEGGCLFDADEAWRRQPLADRWREMEEKLCAVCQVFGSTVCSGRVQVDDLPLAKEFEPLVASLVEVRDGVGIDRDAGTAVENLKFNYEVVPSLTAFRFYLTAENLVLPTVENPKSSDEALLALGLLEMMNGAVPLGGKSTRGLGRCRLHLESIYHFDFSQMSPFDAGRLLDYLRPPDQRQQKPEKAPRTFLEECVRRFMMEEGRYAKAAA